MSTAPFAQLRRENEQVAARVNEVWGQRVAWVEDRAFVNPSGGTQVFPVVVSTLVGGRVPGRVDPAFFAGPAVGRIG